MKTQKLIVFTLAIWCINTTCLACIYFGDSPQNYTLYNVLEKSKRGEVSYYYNPNYKERNLELWKSMAEHYREDYELSEIENGVYKYSLDELSKLYNNREVPEWDKNNRWVQSVNRFALKYLLVAKQCEVARAWITDPWYYPSSKQAGFSTLEDILVEIDKEEHQLQEKNDEQYSYHDEYIHLSYRYALQRTRIYFSLGRYDDCIKLWNDYAVKLPDDNLMKTMIKDYVAGAYCHIGDTITAKRMYFEQGNYWEIARLTKSKYSSLAKVIKAMYDIEPNCNDIAAFYMQADLVDMYMREEEDITKLNEYYDVMCYITRTNRSRDMGIWYYTKAYLEYKLNKNTAAVKTITKAENLKTNTYIHNNIRLLRMYLNAITLPATQNYENRLYNDLCWLDTLIRNNITPDVRNLLLDEEASAYHWHKMWYNYSFYYYNDMMRKIVLGAAAPRLLAAGKKTRALQLYNYADNMLLQEVIESPSLCFKNYFFSAMYHDCTGAEIETYIARTQSPQDKFDQLLNKGSLLNTNYLYDIAGTVYLCEQNYKKAAACLNKVSRDYQKQLHTAGYMNVDPFSGVKFTNAYYDYASLSKSYYMKYTDYKFDFAQEMCNLQRVMDDPQIDINRRATAQLRYAIGLRNSYFVAWPLTQYSQGCPSFAESYREWMNSEREDEIIAKYDKLITGAMKMFTNDEAAADAHYLLLNTYTLVTNYPNTQAAKFIKGRCDTYYDYHLERHSKRYIW